MLTQPLTSHIFYGGILSQGFYPMFPFPRLPLLTWLTLSPLNVIISIFLCGVIGACGSIGSYRDSGSYGALGAKDIASSMGSRLLAGLLALDWALGSC